MRKLLAIAAITALSTPISSLADEPWDSLAACESTNTNANTGNGFYGYYQFDQQTWESTGRTGLASDYSREEQTAAAADLAAARGGQPWPNCWPGDKSIPAADPPAGSYAPPAPPTRGVDLALTG